MIDLINSVGIDFVMGYVGPGAGLTMTGALMAVLAVLGLALVGPILYPIKLLRGWLRRRSQRAASVAIPHSPAISDSKLPENATH